jgi:hypothetical protein
MTCSETKLACLRPLFLFGLERNSSRTGYLIDKMQTLSSSFLKSLSLALLVMQTASLVLVMRYSRTVVSTETPRYLSSTAVVNAEVIKLLTCLLLVWYETGTVHTLTWMPNAKKLVLFSVSKGMTYGGLVDELNREIVSKPYENLKLSVPSALYTIQNNLLFLSLSNLDAATYQVSRQRMYSNDSNAQAWILAGHVSAQDPHDGGLQCYDAWATPEPGQMGLANAFDGWRGVGSGERVFFWLFPFFLSLQVQA